MVCNVFKLFKVVIHLFSIFIFIALPSVSLGEEEPKDTETTQPEISYSLPIKVIEDEISLPLMDFKAIRDTISSYNLIPNRRIATALVFIGYEQLEAKDPARALEAFETAEFIDKTYFPAYLGQAEALTKKNVLNLLYKVPYKILAGLFFCFKDFWQLSFFLGESTLLFLTITFLLFAIFVVLLFLKHEVCLRHDIQELLRARAGTLAPACVMWIMILICLYLGGIFWLLIILGVVLFSYFNKREKIIFVVFLLLFSLSSLLLLTTSVYLSSFGSDFLRVAVDYLNGSVVRGHLAELTKYIERHPKDFMAKFLLASMKSKFGIYNRDAKMLYSSLEDYEALKRIKPNMSKLYNNTGNIYFSLSNYRKAIIEYQKAIELDSYNMAAYYNLNLALKKILEFDEANKALEKAKKLNRALVLYNTSLRIPNQNEAIRLMRQELTFDELWEREKIVSGQKEEERAFMEQLWADLVKGVEVEDIPIFFPLVIIATFLFYFIRKRFDIPQNCEKCGVTFCKRCITGKEKKGLCLPCTQLSSKGSSISPELRLAKLAQIRKYERAENYKIKILSFLIPGSGHFYAGKTYQGVLFLGFWLLISSIIITGIDILSFPWNIHMSGILWVIYLPFVAIAISFYFYVNFYSINALSRQKSKI